ncbi:ferredoxin reductase family protein [Candidatus Fermentibacteria bacterium]|nr:ferredoxin reductase family protein [Candidatus Fermentibacteria bacterium]
MTVRSVSYELAAGSSLKVGWCVMLLAILLAPLMIMFVVSPVEDTSFWRALARGSALVAGAMLVVQGLLAARLRCLDQAFGHDVIMRFHRKAGFFAVGLAFAHPVFLAIDDGSLWFLSFDVGWRIGLGKISLAALMGAALVVALGRFDYLRRRTVHGMLARVATLSVLGHGFVMGSDGWIGALHVFWWGLAGVFVVTVLYGKIYMPRWGRGQYVVASVLRQTHDTWTVELTPKTRAIRVHYPGQFMFLRIEAAGRREEHPFTIASAPRADGGIAATIKESGDFTRGIGSVKPGSRASVEGPFGRFCYQFHAPSSLVFIAGGVGITPVMSMLRHLRDTGDARPAVLLFGNKTEEDIIFRDELKALPATVRVVHILSNPSSTWNGPLGYVTADSIREHAADLLAVADVYLCGPPVMMDKVIRALRDLNVPRHRIHYERFAL